MAHQHASPLYISHHRADEEGKHLVRSGKAKAFRVFRRIVQEGDRSLSIGYTIVTYH